MTDEEKLPTVGSTRTGSRNPHQHTRFKKGQSGNPKGRPKGTLNLATVLARTLREKVVINEHGQRKVVTKLEAAVKQLVNRAAELEACLQGERKRPIINIPPRSLKSICASVAFPA